jgi:hypothetical protein
MFYRHLILCKTGLETWTLTELDQKHLESFETWCWRRMDYNHLDR